MKTLNIASKFLVFLMLTLISSIPLSSISKHYIAVQQHPNTIRIIITNLENKDISNVVLKLNLSPWGCPMSIVLENSTRNIPFAYEYENGEVGSDPSKWCGSVWLRIPGPIPAFSSVALLVRFYGECRASSGDSIFLFYDDFNDGTLSNVWSTHFARATESNGYLFLYQTDSTKNNIVLANINITRPFAIEIKMKMQSSPHPYDHIGVCCCVQKIFNLTGHPMGYKTGVGASSDPYARIVLVTGEDKEIVLSQTQISFSLDSWIIMRFILLSNGSIESIICNESLKLLAFDSNYVQGSIGICCDLESEIPAVIDFIKVYRYHRITYAIERIRNMTELQEGTEKLPTLLTLYIGISALVGFGIGIFVGILLKRKKLDSQLC